jgi:hypothetical protein
MAASHAGLNSNFVMGPWKGYVEKLNGGAKGEKMSLVHNFGVWLGLRFLDQSDENGA